MSSVDPRRRSMAGLAEGVAKPVALLALVCLVPLGAWIRGLRGESAFPYSGREESTTVPDRPSASDSEFISAEHHAGVMAVDFSPDGRLLASASADHSVILWSPQALNAVRRLEGHEDRVEAVAFSPDGELLATGSHDKTVRLWDPATGRLVQTLVGHESAVLALAFAPGLDVLASGGADQAVRLWGISTGNLLHTLEGPTGPVASVAFSPEGEYVYGGSSTGGLWRWEPATEKRAERFKDPVKPLHDVPRMPLARIPEGVLEGTDVAWAVGDEVRLGDFEADVITSRLNGHLEDVTALAISPDGQRMASGSFDKTAVLWNVAGQLLQRNLYGHFLQIYSLTFSADGRLLASASADRTVRLWEAETGRLVGILGTPLAAAAEMWDVEVVSTRKKDKISSWMNTWSANSGYVFLLVELRLVNKLQEPNLLYGQGIQLTDGDRMFSCVGADDRILDDGYYLRLYKEAGAEFSETFIFVVPAGTENLSLRFFDMDPVEIS